MYVLYMTFIFENVSESDKKSAWIICRNKNKAYLCNAFGKTNARDDSLAQLVEHNTFNVGVLGSSPRRITETLDRNG